MQKKISLNQQTIWKVKSIQNSKQIKDPLSIKHSGPRSRDYILVTKIKSKNLQNYKDKLSIPENQSNASFKLTNQ
jgi:hypothetical protein